MLGILLGPDAHHGRDNERELDAVGEEHTQPGKREDTVVAQTEEAGEQNVGDEVGTADERLVSQRGRRPSPGQSAQKSRGDGGRGHGHGRSG